jgi:hypothetical protein
LAAFNLLASDEAFADARFAITITFRRHRRLVPPILVIASEAKQSSAEVPHWIASSLRSSQ